MAVAPNAAAPTAKASAMAKGSKAKANRTKTGMIQPGARYVCICIPKGNDTSSNSEHFRTDSHISQYEFFPQGFVFIDILP